MARPRTQDFIIPASGRFMLDLNLFEPSKHYRILCLGAHSDDIEIGCGGTILAMLERNPHVTVHWVVFSGIGKRADEARMGAESFLTRAREKKVDIFQYRDGFFPFVGAQIKQDFEAFKQFDPPDLILTHYRDDRHQDHRMISDLTWNTFRNHLILEYEIPKFDGDLGSPNLFSALAEPICKRKVELLMQSYATQRSKAWFDEQTFLALLRLRGMECNSPSRYAEGFYCRKLLIG